MAVNVVPQRAPVHGEAEQLAAHLYATHSDRILRYCADQLRSTSEAEDAVQATFLTALRALREGVVPRYELAWLLKVAENVCRTQRRNARYRDRFEDKGETRLEEVAAAPEHEDVDLMRLTRALARLPDTQRSAVLLREWRGLSCREIAELMNTTVAATEMLLFRARRTLAAFMSDEPVKRGRNRVASALNLGQLLPAFKSLVFGAVAVNAAVGVAAMAIVPLGATTPDTGRALEAASPAVGAAQRGARAPARSSSALPAPERVSAGASFSPLRSAPLEAPTAPVAGPAPAAPGGSAPSVEPVPLPPADPGAALTPATEASPALADSPTAIAVSVPELPIAVPLVELAPLPIQLPAVSSLPLP
jgi:RNA polymerase sigma factor (sigma-70 family)